MILELLKGDCLVEMKSMQDNSIDALITDPPAGIAFMNKEWDKDKGGRNHWIAWFEEIMEECYRVLKPGAHGLVWALPRTSHWTATALENAGFEIRDVVNHIFGSGFPKSHDVSKAIDKAAGAKREVTKEGQQKPAEFSGVFDNSTSSLRERRDIPATFEAKQWEGFGTALKPSVEIWLLVAKPFTTVPLDAIIDKINSDLRELLCHQLPAKYVQQISTSNLRESSGQQFGFAQWTVDVFHIIESLETEPKTDTSISQDVVLIFSNIAMSWKAILDVLLLNRNTFTTKTESNLITELKTLRYSILQTMQKNITQELMKQNAEMFIASTVLASLVSALLRLKGLMEIFALEHVSTQAKSLENPRENQQILGLEIVEGALKNQHEHWVLIRKPLGEKTVAANVLKHGTGALNIDASRIESIGDHKRPFQPTNNDRAVLGKQKGFHPTNADGRFPANLVLSEDAAKELDEHSGELTSGKPGKRTKDWSGYATGLKTLDQESGFGDSGGASRFFYVAKASKSDKGADNTHPTVKSTKLMEYLIKLITPPVAIVCEHCYGKKHEENKSKKTNGEPPSVPSLSENVQAVRQPESSQVLFTSVPIQLDEKNSTKTMRTVSEGISPRSDVETSEVLFKKLCDKSSWEGTQNWQSIGESEGVSSVVSAGTSDGQQTGFYTGTSLNNGEPFEPNVDFRRDCSSQERNKIGQSNRELGSLAEENPRSPSEASSQANSVSSLPSNDKSLGSCKDCGEALAKRQPIILDPFMGSGSTGVAAIRNDFKFVGIEQSEEYFAIAEKRLKEGA